MEEQRQVGNRTLVIVHRFDRKGEERLVMAYRSLEDKYINEAARNSGTRPEFCGEQEPEKRRLVCSIGQEVIS